MTHDIAARLGGWSARHRAVAIAGWLLFVVAAMLIGAGSSQVSLADYEQGAGDSARAYRILAEAGITQPAAEVVMVHSDTPGGWRGTADQVTQKVRGTGLATDIQPPVASADGRDGLVQFSIAGDPDTAGDRIQPVLDAVGSVRAASPDLMVYEFGDASMEQWFSDQQGKDFARAEWTAVPAALVILLVAFGALMAAVLPVALALTAFLAANGLLALISHAVHVEEGITSSIMLLMGLAVGVDYSLFYLRRERDERAAGRDRQTALRIAAGTAGRSVLISGLTVIVAMSGMFLSGLAMFKGFAIATVLVVLIAMIGSVTVLPALLSLLGDRVELGRIRLPGFVRHRRSRSANPAAGALISDSTATGGQVTDSAAAGGQVAGGRIAGAVLRPALAHPGLFAAVAVAALLVLAAPAIGIRTEKLSIDKQAPADSPVLVAYQRIQAAFPGGPVPARVVVKAPDIQAPKVDHAIADLRTRLGASKEFGAPVRVTPYPDRDVVVIDVPLAGGGADATSQHALKTLRGTVIPATVGKVADAYVTGELAFDVDFDAQLRSDLVPVFAFVLGIALLLMLVAFRSVPIALLSIALNLLSTGATFGILVAMFQHGWGARLVGTHGVGAIESWAPLFIFVVLFGLSMDYHVFVVSRIREAHGRGMPTRAAVRHGILSTAGVVTSAAFIMVAVFAAFAALSMQDFKQLGVGLAVGVLLDATIIRVLLLPALMSMMGERVWYLPWISRRSRPRSGLRQRDEAQLAQSGPGADRVLRTTG